MADEEIIRLPDSARLRLTTSDDDSVDVEKSPARHIVELTAEGLPVIAATGATREEAIGELLRNLGYKAEDTHRLFGEMTRRYQDIHNYLTQTERKNG